MRTLSDKYSTAEEVDVDSLGDRLRAEIVASRGVVTTWSFITAWARKSSEPSEDA
jgi:hypothetical protein